jgi:hypothetical protein
VEGGHQSRQDHGLATGWSGAAEQRGGVSVELKQLVLGETQGALHRIPKHPQDCEVGCVDEAN